MDKELELDQTTINKIKSLLDDELDSGVATYARYLDDSSICRGCEAVYVASLYPEKFRLLFTKMGWHGNTDYIIALADHSIEDIYHELLRGWDVILDDEDDTIEEEYPFDDFVKDVYTIDDNFQPNSKSIGEAGESGFFLDESVRKPGTKQKYNYAGPVFRFTDVYRNYWADETEALSPRQALSNLTYKFKKKNGFIQNSDYTLDPDYLLCDDESIDVIQPADDVEYCDKCGTRLNDGGTCPVCDDGEVDY